MFCALCEIQTFLWRYACRYITSSCWLYLKPCRQIVELALFLVLVSVVCSHQVHCKNAKSSLKVHIVQACISLNTFTTSNTTSFK